MFKSTLFMSLFQSYQNVIIYGYFLVTSGTALVLVHRQAVTHLFFADFVEVCLFCLFGLLTSSSTTRLYRGRASGQSRETMTSVSGGHIILTPTQPVGGGRPQWALYARPPHPESSALPTELPRPPIL